MKYHDLKCHPDYFNEIWENKKLFDIRINDRNYQINDYVLFREFILSAYTGRTIFTVIKHITKFPEGLRDNYVGLGFTIIYKNITKPRKIYDGRMYKIIEEPITDDIHLKLLLERREIMHNIKGTLNNISHDLITYCQKCNEDRLFCSTCVIPLTQQKIEDAL